MQTKDRTRSVHDWERIAAREAFWGVLTSDDFRSSELTPERIAAFYATGETHVAETVSVLNDLYGTSLQIGRALDIGCGVGRLTRAMRAHAGAVVGYDVSTSMLEVARLHAGAGALYVDAFPEGRFDWINSYIVFQHIPPAEGVPLLKRALEAGADGALASVHMTVWRSSLRRDPTQPLRRALGMIRARLGLAPVETLVTMYDYDMSMVLRTFVEAGYGGLHLRHTDHGGHGGFTVFARRRVRPEARSREGSV